MGVRLTTEQFITIAESKHQVGGLAHYVYNLVDYKSAHKVVVITCKAHGNFSMTPANHTHKTKPQGCPKCGLMKQVSARTHTTANFVKRAQEVHVTNSMPLYNYDMVRYVNARTKVSIVCMSHGEFVQIPTHHLRGSGCPVCADEARNNNRILGIQKFKDKATSVHGPFYGYAQSIYKENNRVDVTITCPIHGVFDQSPSNHLKGHGCPTCGAHDSVAEREIGEFINELNISYNKRDRDIIKPKELDIVIPDHRIAIEYCGNYWHSELNGKTRKYHLNKLQKTEAAGYRLLTIFEDEWNDNSDIVKSRIRNILGKSPKGVGARKLTIKDIDFSTARDFCNEHHIQGSTNHMKHRLGAYDGDQLVAVMTFNPTRKSLGGDGGETELVRFVTDGKTYAGIASRLLKYYQKTNKDTIISYADLRWSDGGLYKSLGFELAHQSSPNYWYVSIKNYLVRKHRFGFRKSFVVEKFNADPINTEWEIMQANGYDRIWDCGNLKFILNT